MTAYLWGAQQGLLTRKSIHNFIRTYHLGEFQKLPSYQAFCRRLNRLAEAFAALAEVLFEQKTCQQRADARVCAGFLPGYGVCRFPVKYCENGAKSLQFNEKSHEKPVVPRRQAARFCAAAAAQASHPLRRTDQQSQSLRPVGCKADRSGLRTGHRRPALCRSCLYRRRMEIPSANRAERRAHHAAKAEKSTMFLFLKMPCPPASVPCGSRLRSFQLAAGQNAHQSASHVRSCAGLLFHIFSSLAFAALLLRFNY